MQYAARLGKFGKIASRNGTPGNEQLDRVEAIVVIL